MNGLGGGLTLIPFLEKHAAKAEDGGEESSSSWCVLFEMDLDIFIFYEIVDGFINGVEIIVAGARGAASKYIMMDSSFISTENFYYDRN